MEDKETTPELDKSKKLSVVKGKTEVLRDKRGRFIAGHPDSGRKLGSKNKMTLVKEQIAEACLENNFKEKFAEMLNSRDKNDFKWAADKAVLLAPKETMQKIDGDISVGPKVVIYRVDPNKKEG
jgi:hypothetical protein